MFQHASNELEIPGVVDWSKHFDRAYQAPPSKHMAAITKPSEVAGLLKAIQSYRETNLLTALLLKFSVLTFVRPGEARQAEWTEIDDKDRLWRVPTGKIKMGRAHLVPLSPQILALLEELRTVSGCGRFLFPGFRGNDRPVCDGVARAALRRIGYSNEDITPHGFRTTASTILHEKGFPTDWIEIQLSHKDRNKVRAAYRHPAEFLEGRKKMMNWWGGYINSLENDSLEPHLPILPFIQEG